MCCVCVIPERVLFEISAVILAELWYNARNDNFALYAKEFAFHASGKTVLQNLLCAGSLPGSAQSAVIQRQHDGYGHAGTIQPKRHERRQPMQPGTVYASDVGRRCGRRRRCTGRPILGKKQAGADPAYHRRCDALRRRHGGRDVPDRAAGTGAASESSI